jgi:hypothetical protein
MSDRLTAEPGTLEFLRQLLEIAKESDHPMDKALAKVLAKQIGEAEVVRRPEGTDDNCCSLKNILSDFSPCFPFAICSIYCHCSPHSYELALYVMASSWIYGIIPINPF